MKYSLDYDRNRYQVFNRYGRLVCEFSNHDDFDVFIAFLANEISVADGGDSNDG